MTPKELNRDIKRLYNTINKVREKGNDEYFRFIDSDARKEFQRLYYADSTMKSWNTQSHIYMLIMNISHRFVPLYLYYPYEK